jgi:hypothetical protein
MFLPRRLNFRRFQAVLSAFDQRSDETSLRLGVATGLQVAGSPTSTAGAVELERQKFLRVGGE